MLFGIAEVPLTVAKADLGEVRSGGEEVITPVE